MNYALEQTCDDDDGYRCQNPNHTKNEHGDCGLPTDNGTMARNVAELANRVVGHRITSAEKRSVDNPSGWPRNADSLVITLDDGTQVALADTDDCCAFTNLDKFLLHPERVDHIITGVGTTGGFEKWHIFADMGDVLELEVGWSCGNPFYYGYGFDIFVVPIDEEIAK